MICTKVRRYLSSAQTYSHVTYATRSYVCDAQGVGIAASRGRGRVCVCGCGRRRRRVAGEVAQSEASHAESW